jgi:hypothetical protein
VALLEVWQLTLTRRIRASLGRAMSGHRVRLVEREYGRTDCHLAHRRNALKDAAEE